MLDVVAKLGRGDICDGIVRDNGLLGKTGRSLRDCNEYRQS